MATTGCTDDGPGRDRAGADVDVAVDVDVDMSGPPDVATPPVVVTVASQRCERPTVHRGVGTPLGDGRILTAAHVVAGNLRTLTVDDRPAHVLALDPRLDLAVVALDGAATDADASNGWPKGWSNGWPIEWPVNGDPDHEPTAGPASVITPGGIVETEIVRVITLRVHDLNVGLVHERPALRLGHGAVPGQSGAPVIDPSGRLVGIVVLGNRADGTSYAVRPPTSTADLPAATIRRGCDGG